MPLSGIRVLDLTRLLPPTARSFRRIGKITGRSDATLNRGGVRLGTSDFYTVVETLPEVADKSWPKNPIDNFVLARLDQEKLARLLCHVADSRAARGERARRVVSARTGGSANAGRKRASANFASGTEGNFS